MDDLVDAGWGLVFPTTGEQRIHNVPIDPSYARVSIDGVNDTFSKLKLPIPPNNEVLTLGQAKGTFIQWPKKDISLDGSRPTKKVSPRPSEPSEQPHVQMTYSPLVAAALSPRRQLQLTSPVPPVPLTFSPLVAAALSPALLQLTTQESPKSCPKVASPTHGKGKDLMKVGTEALMKAASGKELTIEQMQAIYAAGGSLPSAPTVPTYKSRKPMVKNHKKMASELG